MNTETSEKIRTELRNIFKKEFDIEDKDFEVSVSTEEYIHAYSNDYTEFLDEQYIYYIIKPRNTQTNFKLNLGNGNKFETKVFEKYPIVFERFDFSMPIWLGNEPQDKLKYQSISFRDCNIVSVDSTAVRNSLVL